MKKLRRYDCYGQLLPDARKTRPISEAEVIDVLDEEETSLCP